MQYRNINIVMRDEISLPPIVIEEVLTTQSQTADWSVNQFELQKIWKQFPATKGRGVTIGVIDTGVPRHVDLQGNVIAGKNFIPGQDEFDNHGHQTHCVGIICAKDNSIGTVGVAPEAKCLCVKALSDTGSGSYSGLQ